MSAALLVARQNRDGGWPYSRGVSWTEPTVYAILALLSAGETASALGGIRWLQRWQREDGGWPPQPAIEESTWVTALVALIPPDRLGKALHDGAIRWLTGTTGEESTPTYRIREWLLGHGPLAGRDPSGWPWVPGTAAWVAPTSLAILALQKESRRHPVPELGRRIDAGRRFLLARTCNEGGWNHGGVQPLGYPSRAYPETTGLALAALRGVRAPQVSASILLAKKFLDDCRSADAWNWLRLGLLMQGQPPQPPSTPVNFQFRTLPEAALDLMITSALQGHGEFPA